MINVRQGLFETNSSSVHTMIIRVDDWYEQSEYNTDDKKYVIKGDYYGRCPQTPLETTEQKLNYIWTMVNCLYGKHIINWDTKEDAYQDLEKFILWTKMIHDVCPNALLIEPDVNSWNVAIDHSYELKKFAEELENNPVLLLHLLLGYGWIDITGDEYACWPSILPYPWYELFKLNSSTYLYVKGN